MPEREAMSTEQRLSDSTEELERANADFNDVNAERHRWKLRALASEARVARLEEALKWYGENARLCRLIHSEGDKGRHALAADGGSRARAALEDTK